MPMEINRGLPELQCQTQIRYTELTGVLYFDNSVTGGCDFLFPG